MKTVLLLLVVFSFFKASAQTDSTKIAPDIIAKGNNIYWGSDYVELFLSVDKGKTWQRYFEKDSSFISGDHSFSKIELVNDSTAIIWDLYYKQNFLYTLHNRKPQPYFYVSPIDEFLKYPINHILISSANSGCFHYYGDDIEYSLGENLEFKTIRLESRGKDKIVYKKNQELKQEKYFDKDFKLNLTHSQVHDALKEMNENYMVIPRLSDFKITKSDKENYLRLVQKKAEERKQIRRAKPLDVDFYHEIYSQIDTLSDTITQLVFKKPTSTLSTSSVGFVLFFTNSANDTLFLVNRCDDESYPHGWYLGWEVYYKEKRFIVNNLNFSKAVNSWIPANFAFSEYFDNSYVIMSIADYLYKKEHPSKK